MKDDGFYINFSKTIDAGFLILDTGPPEAGKMHDTGCEAYLGHSSSFSLHKE
jgi:hypothetical protein